MILSKRMTSCKVTGSHVHYKNDNISETVQDRDIATTNCYRITPSPMTWSDLQSHSRTVRFLCVFSRTFVQQLTTFQLTESIARSLCDSRATCDL